MPRKRSNRDERLKKERARQRQQKQQDPRAIREKRKRKHTARKVIICVIIGVILAVPAIFVNTAIGYIPIVMYLLLLILSYVYIRILRDRMTFEARGVGGVCYRNESVNFQLAVKNDSFLPAIRVLALFYMSDIFGGEGATDTHSITLGPHREKVFNFSIRFDHIGSYQVGVKEVTVVDLFDIFSAVQENEHLTEVNVQPRLFDLSDMQVSRDATVEAKRNFSAVINDGLDYAGTRDYEWGDPIKTIHWKLSARAPEGQYYTRLYETNANPGLAIIADFDAPAYTVNELMSIYDAVVESAFSIERYAEESDFDVELLFRDKLKQAQRFFSPMADRRQEILDLMPQIFSPGTGKEALGLVEEEVSSIYAQSNLIVCTSVISKELIEVLIAAASGKRTPVLFAIVPSTATDERRKEIEKLLKHAGSAGVYYTIISGAKDLPGASKVVLSEEEAHA